MSDRPPLLEVTGLRIQADAPEGPRTIVSSVDLTIREGETLAIVGESGSGKSMTAKAITGLLPTGVRAGGSIRFEGRSLLELKERDRAKLRGRDIGLVFQDPFTMLNPLITIGDQILEPVRDDRGRRLRGAEADREAARRLAEVGINDPSVADRYPFQLSGGMRQRVGLAASLAADPKLLIADEPATALDVTTQSEVLALLASVREKRGMALILITHDLRIAFSACDSVAVLYAGRLLESGRTRDVEHQPLHPYSLGLLMSEPDSERRLAHLQSISGAVPRPDEVADQCAFAPRCSFAQDRCRDGRPPLARLAPDHSSACLRIDEIAPQMTQLRQDSLAAADAPGKDHTFDALLTVDKLHKVFSTGRGRQNIAVHEASLEVGRGEAVGLVGESGSGKTTLSRCVVGLETPTTGTVTFRDRSAESTDGPRRHAQMVFQDPFSSLNPKMSIESCLSEALRLARPPVRDISAGVDELLSQVGLSPTFRKRRPANLSGGQRQRVAIARALALKPDLLICDEPVSALDVSVQAQILQLLRDVREHLGIGYLVITHDLAVVRQVVDRVYVMQQGRIVESGFTADVLDDPQHPYTQRLVASIPRPVTSSRPPKESEV